MDIWMAIIFATLIAMASAAFGAMVQRKTLFIFPYDPATVLIVILLSVCALFQYPFDYVWYVPALCGYFLGYYINGLTRYTAVSQVDVAGQTIDLAPIVTYEIDLDKRGIFSANSSGKMSRCLADQTWRGLLKRWFLNVHHVIDTCGAPWQPAWQTRTKYPGFPVFVRDSLLIETWDTLEKDYGIGRRWSRKAQKHVPWFTIKRHVSVVRIAHCDQIPRVRLIKNQAALDEQNILLDEAQRKIIDLENERKAISTVKMAELIAGIMDISPQGCVDVILKERVIAKRLKAESEVIGESDNEA